MAKSKIKYGRKSVLPDKQFDPRDAKVRISLILDGDVLDAYRDAAKATDHGEYQTLMKQKLREAIMDKAKSSNSLAMAFMDLKNRVSSLERKNK